MRKFIIILLAVVIVIPFVSTIKVEAAECSNQIAGKTRAQLEAELEACNAEIAQWTATLNKTKQESASFSRDVSALTAKINAAQATIKSKNIAINNIAKDISTKQTKITELGTRISESKKSIADILRKTNDIHSYSMVEALLSNKDFSEFFVDVDTYASTGRALDNLLAELGSNKKLTEAEKDALNKKREAEASAKAALEASKREVELANAEKKTLLAASQTKEKTYAQVVADRQAKASQIRNTLFPLVHTGAIPFGTALQYAEAASAKTGVSPALILAILQQESSLGANVGTCVITDLTSGSLKNVNSGKIFPNGIKPDRDLKPLQEIVTALGRDPLSTKVSCPLSVGYGGAMGPTQFIPSTWNMILPSLKTATGKTMPDPWNAADAIMAAGILLKGNMGTTGDKYTDERTAACRYYSGQTCYVNGGAGRGLSYGNQVMNRVAAMQRDIDTIKLASN